MSELPSHVPPHLVKGCPIGDRRLYFEDIFQTILPAEHAKPPVYWSSDIYVDGSGGWVARKAEHLREILADGELFSSKGLSGFAEGIGEDWDLIPLEIGGDTHNQVRKVLNPELSPQKMMALTAKVHDRAETLIRNFADRGECEFIQEFASPFPVTIFLDIFGLPQELYDEFLVWGAKTQNPEQAIRAEGTREIKAYLLNVIAERRRNPRDDLISRAITYELNGEPWSDDMIFGYYFNMFVGGLDTVATNLGLQFQHLARHPEQQAMLRADPSRIPLAIEELLRLYSPITVYRTVTRDTQFHDVEMKAGDKIAVSFAIASRDPDAWDSPNEALFDRRPVHLGFGAGAHRCVGMHLARRELVAALEKMLAMLPPFEIKPGTQVPFWMGNILGVRSLTLSWKA